MVLIATVGCGDPAPPAPSASKPAAPAAIELTVLVAGDEGLAEGVRLLRGEWKARSGGELRVEAIALEDLQKSESLAADLVIFPSRLLGGLVEQSKLRPLRNSLLESPALDLADIFPAIRNGEMRYGGETFALPLGSPPLLAVYRRDFLEAHGGDPPRTWAEFRKLGTAEAAAAEEWDPSSVHFTPPMAGRTAAYTLIARATSYTEAQRRAESLFNAADMKARIADPAFVRALAELTAELAVAQEQLRVHPPADFTKAVRLVRSGQAGMTFGWPGLAAASVEHASRFTIDLALLPAAEQVYSTSQNGWVNQVARDRVTLLGAEGRLASVTARTRNAVSAFQLAQWLTTGDVAVSLSSRSDGTLWFRESQAAMHAKWTEPTGGRDEEDGAAAATEALRAETPVMIPRVPGIDEYLEVLADAVRAAEPGEEAAKAALSAAAEKWEAITERLGREGQARAYRRHLGIDSVGSP